MPTYSVQVSVNVPGVGDRTFTQNNITAANIEAAIAAARLLVVITALQAQQTAP